MIASTPVTIPAGNDVLSISLSITPYSKVGSFTARAMLATQHFRADSNNNLLSWSDGTPMNVGPQTVESHNDVFADAAGNGTADPGQATLAAAVAAAIGTYMATASPAFPGQTVPQAYAASVVAIQTALATYCAAAGK